MDYSLVKRLKDAGFPQSEYLGSKYLWEFSHRIYQIGIDVRPIGGESAYVPNTEELIEACGENIESIHFLPDMNMVTAHSVTSFGIVSKSITLLGAVAELWLALQGGSAPQNNTTDGYNEILDKDGNFVMAVGDSLVKDALEVVNNVSPEKAPHNLTTNK